MANIHKHVSIYDLKKQSISPIDIKSNKEKE
jgi:hypothetical protein